MLEARNKILESLVNDPGWSRYEKYQLDVKRESFVKFMEQAKISDYEKLAELNPRMAERILHGEMINQATWFVKEWIPWSTSEGYARRKRYIERKKENQKLKRREEYEARRLAHEREWFRLRNEYISKKIKEGKAENGATIPYNHNAKYSVVPMG